MSLSAAEIDALIAAGVSAEQLGAVLKAGLAVEEAKRASKRAGATERKRRQRGRDADVTPVTRDARDDAGQGVTERDPFQDKESPPDPQRKPNHPVECISTREAGPTSDQLVRVAVLRQAFAAFWAEYPRRKARPDAERAYAKALAKPDVSPAVILEGLRRHLGGWATGDPAFVPHPATWLNREGWNDEADAPPQPRLIHDRPGPHPSRTAPPSRAETRDAVWSQLAAEEDGARVGGSA